MKERHLQLNLAKTEFLVFPATPTLQHDFTIQINSSTITPSSSVRNLGVIFDDQLTFKDHIAKTAQSCWFALHNISKIRPFLTQHAAQLLIQALVISRLDYGNALLAGLPSCTIRPLQMVMVNTGQESQAKTVSVTAEEIQGLTSNPENVLFRGHRKCIDSVHLSVV